MADQKLTDVITTAAVKAYIFAGEATPPSTWDTLLGTLCTAAIAMLQQETGSLIEKATYTAEKASGRGTSALDLKGWPIISVTSLADETGTTYTAGYDEDYVIEDLQLRATNGGRWARGSGNFTCTYIAGYATIPSDLVLVALEWIARKFKTAQQQSWGESSRNYPDGSSSTVNADGALTKAQQAVLAKYRRPRV
jgi:hypothetical protein